MQRSFAVLCLLLSVAGCSENYTHDEKLAAEQAVEFAKVAFIQHDFDRSYLLLADKARAYVPLEKFKEKVTYMHPNGYPLKVAVVAAAPIKGEKIVHVALHGDGSGGKQFDYTLTLVGTAQAGYRVTTFSGGAPSSLPPG
jgi:hypothetical protein